MATQKKKATQVAKKPIAKKVSSAKQGGANKKASAKGAKKTLSSKNALRTKKAVNTKKSPKTAVPTKKSAKSIVKPSPAKKSAKPVVKKAAPKKVANSTKKAAVKKPAVQTKKTSVATKKAAPVKKTVSKEKKEVVSKTPVVNINEHKKELKKAMIKAKKTKDESKKAEKPFVMPKTHTEKSRKYEPQFIKSVLDQAPEEDNGPTMRYSDTELAEFRELISRKLETAKKELGYLQGLITRKDEMGGDDTDNRYMTMEDGSLSMEREQLSQMASRQITFIDHLEKAMMRIENKTYGICRVTGKLIDKARLRAVPHATLSIEAKMGIAR